MRHALIVSAALVMLVGAADGWACSCISGGGVREALDAADAVFLGEVTDVRRAEPEWVTRFRHFKTRVLHSVGIEDKGIMRWYRGPKYGMVVTFDARKEWKGGLAKTIEVRTGYGGGDCGFSFDVGKEYVVYAYSSGGDFFTGICTRTTTASPAKEEIAELDAATRDAASP